MKSLFTSIPRRSLPTIGFISLTVLFLWVSLPLSRTSVWIPQAVLALTLLLLLLQLAVELIDASKIRQLESVAVPAGDSTLAGTSGSERRRGLVMVVVWVLTLLLLLWSFGVTLGLAAFCLAYLRWHADEPWLFSTTFALVLGGLVQLIFGALLQAGLYPGVILKLMS